MVRIIPDICKMKNKKEHCEISTFFVKVLIIYHLLIKPRDLISSGLIIQLFTCINLSEK